MALAQSEKERSDQRCLVFQTQFEVAQSQMNQMADEVSRLKDELDKQIMAHTEILLNSSDADRRHHTLMNAVNTELYRTKVAAVSALTAIQTALRPSSGPHLFVPEQHHSPSQQHHQQQRGVSTSSSNGSLPREQKVSTLLSENPEHATHATIADVGTIVLHAAQQLHQQWEDQQLALEKRQLDLDEALDAVQRNEEMVEVLVEENRKLKETISALRIEQQELQEGVIPEMERQHVEAMNDLRSENKGEWAKREIALRVEAERAMQAVLHQSETSLSHKLRSLEERHAAEVELRDQTLLSLKRDWASRVEQLEGELRQERLASLQLQSQLTSAEQRAEQSHHREIASQQKADSNEDEKMTLLRSMEAAQETHRAVLAHLVETEVETKSQLQLTEKRLAEVTVERDGLVQRCQALETESNAMSSELLETGSRLLQAQLQADDALKQYREEAERATNLKERYSALLEERSTLVEQVESLLETRTLLQQQMETLKHDHLVELRRLVTAKNTIDAQLREAIASAEGWRLEAHRKPTTANVASMTEEALAKHYAYNGGGGGGGAIVSASSKRQQHSDPKSLYGDRSTTPPIDSGYANPSYHANHDDLLQLGSSSDEWLEQELSRLSAQLASAEKLGQPHQHIGRRRYGEEGDAPLDAFVDV